VADDSLARLYLRALTPKRAPRAVPEAWTAPSVSRALVPVDAEHLRRYRRLCGFPDGPTLPPTYPHLTAFPMGMALLTRREFPYPVLGLVHIRNEIEQLRPIAQTETLDYHVWIDKPYRHEKGAAFEVRAEVSDSAGDLVWRSSSTYLRRTAAASRPSSNPAIDSRDGAGAATATAVPSSTVAWRLPADLGRRYAALSGDRNPIHLYPWTARLFGFRRQIAHGMWSAARCLAALNAPGTATKAETETATETELTFTVDLRAAVLLPSEVALATARGVDGTTEFCLTSAGGDRTHLTGRLVFAP
jgi:acyl dehydratase